MDKKKKKIVLIGLGYVGLPTFVAISKTKKYEVVGFTPSGKRVKEIMNGSSPIEDADVTYYLKNNKVNVSNNPDILNKGDIFIICVPTPVNEDFEPDYSPVISATKLVAQYLRRGSHFVLESTVNPGTCEEIVQPLLEKETELKAGIDFNIAHCPERINPGDTKWNIYNINRNIGSINNKFNKEIASFYRSFVTKAVVNEVTSLKVAEATKIIENTFRDINIAYVNELAQSFDLWGIDLIETINASSNKPFAFMPHFPGCGVGGHCIAVDPYYLIKRASLNGFNHRFLKVAREINNSMPEYTVNKLLSALKDSKLKDDAQITLLGLSYKADIGDTRESPALKIKKLLLAKKCNLKIYDPFVKSEFKNLKDAVSKSKALIIATAHKEFIEKLPEVLIHSQIKVIIDGRNCLNKKQIQSLGIVYKGIGR